MNYRASLSVMGCALIGSLAAACGGAASGPADHETRSSDLQEDGGGQPDGDLQSDGGSCVDIDLTTYDTSCHADSDCIDVNAGTICPGYGCACGGSAINIDGQARYNAAFDSVSAAPGLVCECPYLGDARCVQSQCVYCPKYPSGPVPAGCGDGG